MSIIQTLATSLPAFDRRFHLYAPKFIVGDINGDHLVQELMDPRGNTCLWSRKYNLLPSILLTCL